MNMTVILITLVLLAASSYYVGLKKSISIQKSEKLHSAPIYHGSLLAIYSLIVSLLFILIWYLFENYLYPEFSVSRNLIFFFILIGFFNNSPYSFSKDRKKFSRKRKKLKILLKFFY